MAHRNRGLFSDHYLNEHLPGVPAWSTVVQAASDLLPRLRSIFAAYTPSANEAQTEQDLIKPVLEALGHCYEVQASLAVPGSQAVRPDYVFFRDGEAREALKGRTLAEGAIEGGLAVGDAKYWDRPLDQAIRGGSDAFTNKNPGFQIAFYLQHSGLPWGILTNGRLWRLYHRDSAHRLDRYYEVDLPALVEGGDPAALCYFTHFFGPGAYLGGPLALGDILKGSADFAQGVGDRLKSQVYDALWTASEGFLAYEANGLRPTDETLREVHENALIVLYRLLFVFFAEARGLLPLAKNDNYTTWHSLDAIKKEVARRPPASWPVKGATLWPRLIELFRIIDVGEAEFGVPSFNGGLFSKTRHPRLAAWQLGDRALAASIDKLARVDGDFVDYRDLASQHLGTIYEGLLEFHLRLAPDADLHGWTTQLVNSKGERKASGSYYTPGYITRFMTERCLGPVVDEALATGREAKGTKEGSKAAQAKAVLSLNVLDPAMGSGHFLVEAIDYLAERLVAADLLPEDLRAPDGKVLEPGIERSATGRGIDELAYWKRRVAQSCVYGVDINPMAVELAKLSIWLSTAAGDRPLSFLDHHLRAGNSLVGTRLADLTGDGAAPASDSAGGSRSRKGRASKGEMAAAMAAGQLSWFADDSFRRTVSTAVDSMWLIEENPAATVEDVRKQEALYASLRQQVAGQFKARADVLAARRFGLRVAGDQMKPLLDLAAGRALAAPAPITELLAAAERTAAAQAFFHWELEFPEVFFDRNGQALGVRGGFDAVLGNPPYVRQEELGPLKPYLAEAYPQTFSGVADLYVYFYQRGLELLRAQGRMSYIVTNKWMRAGYGQPLRGWLAGQNAVSEVIDFGHAPIFQDADVFPCILFLERQDQDAVDPAAPHTLITEFPRDQLHRVTIADYVARHAHRVPRRRFSADPWSLEPQPVVDLMDKIRRVGIPLAEFAGVKPYYGIKTGLNEAFLIDTATKERLVREDPRSAEIIKPYLRGQDIKRWAPEWAGLWMIVIASSSDREWPWSGMGANSEAEFASVFPAIHGHLKPFEEGLQRRQDKGRSWWELRPCSYYDVFDKPTIIHTDITWRSQFALTRDHRVLLNTAYVWPSDDRYTLAVLNAPVLWWLMWRTAMHGKDEALRLIYSFVETLPIAPPTPAIRAEVEPAVERLIAITQADQEARAQMLDWLRTEFEVLAPGQKLEGFGGLSSDGFVAEVKARLPRAARALSPDGLKRLRETFDHMAPPVQQRQAEAGRLERRVAELVNQAYGLTAEEVALLWRTAPPRMPVGGGDGGIGHAASE